MFGSLKLRSPRGEHFLFAVLTACVLLSGVFWLQACGNMVEQAGGKARRNDGVVVTRSDASVAQFATVAPADQDAGVFSQNMRVEVNDATLNKGWKFFKDAAKSTAAEAADFDDTNWEPVNLPHTWNNLDGQNGPTTNPAYFRGVGWYRKIYNAPSALNGKQIYLQFDASAYITDVWINGTKIGQHRGGYAAFRFDITSVLNIGGSNVFAIKVDNSEGVTSGNQMPTTPADMSNVAPLSGDFTMFGGIYRVLHIVATDKLAISPMDFGSPGVYMTAYNVTSAGADFEAKVMLANAFGPDGDGGTGDKNVSVEVQVLDKDAQKVLWVLNGKTTAPPYKPTDPTDLTTLARNYGEKEPPSITLQGHLDSPHLWDGLADPYVHRVNIILRDADTGAVVDAIQQPFGFRSIKMNVDTGFELNGKSYPLRGVNMHQDHKNRGGAFDITDTMSDPTTGVGKPTIDRDFEMLKEIGCTFVRYAHYQHNDYTYSKADALGIVAWAENAFVNRIPLPPTPAFQNNTNQQYAELIKQNFNHPSIAFWSMSNEILISEGPDPTAVEASLNVIHKKLDQSRYNCSASQGFKEQEPANWQGDLAAFNEYQGWYVAYTKDFASWVDDARRLQQQNHAAIGIGVSEYGAGANPDPTYTHELPIFETGANRTNASQTEEYQAFYHEVYYKKILASPFLVLTSVWNMFDFASDYRNEGFLPGENTKGLVTFDRSIQKDAFFMYKSQWSKVPFAHIKGRRYLTMPKATTEVQVYSNQPSVTLKLNGATVGTITDADNQAAGTLPHLFIFKGVPWVAGANAVQAVAGEASDTVTWQ
jgi:beta-galactosidase